MKNNVTVVILAAGLGTRMKSKKAKVLHEAGGDTLLNQIIRAALHVAPAERIVAVVGHQADKSAPASPKPGIRFAEQKEQKGTGHAVLCARAEAETANGQLLILNGDGPLLRPETLRRLVENAQRPPRIRRFDRHHRSGRSNWLWPNRARCQQSSRGHRRTKIRHAEQLKIREINPGLYCFDAKLFWNHIGEVTPNNAAKEYYLTDMVEILTRHGHPVAPSWWQMKANCWASTRASS